MKKVGLVALIIGGLVVLLILVGIYKYVYVPKGEVFRIKYIDLTKEVEGHTNEIVGEFTNSGFHTRLGFQSVGDSITYTFVIVNDGTIEGKLFRDPIIIGKDNVLKNNVTRFLYYKDGGEIKKGDTLKPGERVTIEYKVIYSDSEMFSYSDGNHFEVTILFPYLQNR